MVQRGQFLERPTLIKSGPHTLEGLWHRGDRPPAALLIPPLPGDGSMDASALNELAFTFSRAGHPSLRFNFGGVGASQGASKTAAAQLRDAKAALKLLRENAGFDDVYAIGFRSGARVAIALAPQVVRVALVAPPDDLDLGALADTTTEALFAIAEADPSRSRWGSHCARTGDRLEVVEAADLAWNRGLPQLAKAVVGFVPET